MMSSIAVTQRRSLSVGALALASLCLGTMTVLADYTPVAQAAAGLERIGEVVLPVVRERVLVPGPNVVA